MGFEQFAELQASLVRIERAILLLGQGVSNACLAVCALAATIAVLSMVVQ